MRKYHALPVALLAALALTACQNGTGTKDEGAAHPDPASATVTATDPAGDGDSGKGTTGATGTQGTTGATGAQGTTGATGTQPTKGDKSAKGDKAAKGTTATRVSCNGSNTTVTAQPVRRPLNHMLLTVKNTGSKMCDLTYYPVLRFDEMQWVPRPIKDSKPQAVTTLAPGESGYAGVSLSAADGSGEWGTTSHKLTVGFQGRTPNSDGGPSALPTLPAKGVYYDSTLTVTYWLRDMDDALTY
ncbi:Protein of unknown function [Streptomyces sp. Ag82_O1-12]|uniref:DUF4232 domain-containing protein n=1 Tax=unclassified Streptomyces TaxID=2593676 RepID=UPI000BC47C09|nr:MULTISPECIES: DUF4232 domain-containing protein [unclassified Streptomyces]SMQ18040.1 Protein of unknown function [Streptomyces sp. Ag82_O1-12]SOD47077.1 Protein of unknown function [Streptomyces sp. Ag82_G6-1]